MAVIAVFAVLAALSLIWLVNEPPIRQVLSCCIGTSLPP
jgi:hypothetical protein